VLCCVVLCCVVLSGYDCRIVASSPNGRTHFFLLHNLPLEEINIFYVRHVIFQFGLCNRRVVPRIDRYVYWAKPCRFLMRVFLSLNCSMTNVAPVLQAGTQVLGKHDVLDATDVMTFITISNKLSSFFSA
jgi:hypothetical protein